MSRRLWRRLMSSGHPEDGVSAVTVLLMFVVLLALVLTTSEYAARSVRPAAAEIHWERAGSAAQSGLAEYTSLLRADPVYWESVDCANPALVGQDPAVVPHTCPWPAGTVGWAPVESGGDPAKDPAYHYEVTQAAVEAGDRAASITVTVTGRSGGTYRTLQARLTRASSSDYVVASDFWLVDPAVWKEYNTSTLSPECGGATVELTRYLADRSVSCPNAGIYLGTGESLTGKVMINDAARFNGGVINGQYWTAHEPCRTATADPSTWTARCLTSSSGYNGTTTFSGIQPKYTTPQTLPDNSGSFAALPGCHYYGATRIVLLPTGRMRVWSRDTAAAVAAGKPLAVATDAGVVPNCGSPASLASAAGQDVPVPNGMVVYVANVPTIAGVPNEPLGAGAIGGDATYGSLPIGGYTGAAPASTTSKTTIDPDIMTTRKYRPMGNLYLEGTLDGFVTLAAEGSVVMTGDLVLAGGMSGDDMAGIVAGHSVEIYRPVTRELAATSSGAGPVWNFTGLTAEGTALAWVGGFDGGTKGAWPHRYVDADRHEDYPASGLQIQASVQALTHSMYVQQFWSTEVQSADANRQLIVQGSIGTRFSGLTTSGEYGYRENHRYDPRLSAQTPPYLALFEESQWEAGAVGEIPTPDALRG